ncbi:hypothetical protein BpHYR1_008608 [Brachionus plicatilis]|uniref:Uncharacterized protein n=1 Tax=Brachionus plicatilis TaxID=10195 RepID=A0A3M7RAN2_BRAPC|nr:hypothetical protein BpHYR1_008608 [Brachionus plicatilis]
MLLVIPFGAQTLVSILIAIEPFIFADFGSSIFEPDLNSGFGNANSSSQILSHINVRISSALEQFFQLGQLKFGELSALSSLAPLARFDGHLRRGDDTLWLLWQLITGVFLFCRTTSVGRRVGHFWLADTTRGRRGRRGRLGVERNGQWQRQI